MTDKTLYWLDNKSCLGAGKNCVKVGDKIDPKKFGADLIAKLTKEFKPIDTNFFPEQEKTNQEVFLEQEKKKAKPEKIKSVKIRKKPESSEPVNQIKMKKKQEQIGMFE